jgi:hypothetical protein
MNDAEDRRVRADAEGEREHDEQREPRILPKETQRESKILSPLGQQFANSRHACADRRAPRRIRLKLLLVAEPAKRFGPRVRLTHAEGAQLIGAHVDVDSHLVAQLTRDAVSTRWQLEDATDRRWQER